MTPIIFLQMVINRKQAGIAINNDTRNHEKPMENQ